MTVHKTLKFLVILCIYSYSTYGQQWQAGDTLKTIEKDTTRIELFRGNTLNYTGQDLLDDSFPKSWPIFGTKARMAIGGYARIDYIQDFDGGYDRFQYEIQFVPVKGDGRPAQSGYMNLHARESRLNVDFRTVTETGMPLQVFFEFDFFNTDREPLNQTPRLRHFYGVLGRLLIGRTWGTASDLYAVPATIDFAAGDALTFTRRAQIRFEDYINDTFKYAVAIEMLEYPGIDGRDFAGQASQKLPLLSGRITKSTTAGGRLFLGANLFQLRWDGEGVIPNSAKIGWCLSFSGREYFGAKKHWFRWMASYGEGSGSQILATIGTQGSGTLNDEGKLETMPAWNLGTGLCINLSKTLATNLNLNYFGLEPSVYRDEHNMKAGGAGHLNLVWSPIENVNTGIEFMVIERENVNKNTGVGKRLQFMIKYLF